MHSTSYITELKVYIQISFIKDLFIYLFLAVLFLKAAHRLPLVAASGGYSLAVVHGLLTVVLSVVAEHDVASVVAAPRL